MLMRLSEREVVCVSVMRSVLYYGHKIKSSLLWLYRPCEHKRINVLYTCIIHV